MKKLSNQIGNLKDYYPIVIIGSGYGGSIAASRLSRAGQQVCVLERGREFPKGKFPNTFSKIRKETQTDWPSRHSGKESALFDIRVNKEINVVVGCGLGGTSLINANVAMMPNKAVFEDSIFPQALRDDITSLYDIDARHAKEMLRPAPYPTHFPKLAKLEVLENIADSMGEKFYRTPINVNFEDQRNHVGIDQPACKLCGDCVSGCNYDSKNTLAMNYLPDAKKHGAEIFTRIKVNRIARQGDQWLIFFNMVEYGMERFKSPEMFIRADKVILAAGTLGSTQILLNSKNGPEKLALSDKLGERFSGNGDFIGFGYNSDIKTNILGYGNKSPEGRKPVGPCITGIIDMRNEQQPNKDLIIEDGTIHGGVANRLLSFGLAIASVPLGKDTDRGLLDWLKEKWRQFISFVFGPYYGAPAHTEAYLSASQDSSKGKIYIKDNKVRVDWPNAGHEGNFDELNQKMFEATKPIGGTYIRNPLWNKLLGYDLVTAHPLGGCVMAENAELGVVNDKCQVFSGTSGKDVHEGLYVMDGSIVPRSLGINPLLTISTLSERACRLMAKDNNWSLTYDFSNSNTDPRTDARIGFEFSHANRGYFSKQVRDIAPRFEEMARFFKGEKLGKDEKSKIDFILTVDNNDIDFFLSSAEHQGKLLGSVVAPQLSEHPLTVTEGQFNLLIQDPKRPRGRYLYYRFKMITREGKYYYFDGFRAVHDDPGYDGVLSDMSIMYFTIHEGDSFKAPIIGTGILRLNLKEFIFKQFGTLSANNISSKWEGFKTKFRFVAFFVKTMIKVFRWKVLLPGSNRRRGKKYGY